MDTSYDSIYVVDLPNKDYIDLLNDICRMVIIQFAIQFLFYINNTGETDFFSSEFILLIIYIVLAVCLYWLVFKKLVVFK